MNEEKLAKEFEKKLSALLSKMQQLLANAYSNAEVELCILFSEFDFSAMDSINIDKHPNIAERYNTIVETLNKSTYNISVENITSAWVLSDLKNKKFIKGYFQGRYDELESKLLERYNPENKTALKSFLERKINGLNLSERVWKYNSQYKTLIENALQIGIGNGINHKDMADYLRRYLQNPSATILEVDKNGVAQKIPAKPQIGVYSKPEMNARRLARTEINMAYRNADILRWRDEDFVVGYEVKLSHNHTTKVGNKVVALIDICDELQGKYPLDFMFCGWHPQCRCYCVPILKTTEEQIADENDLLDNDVEPIPKEMSTNYIADVPANFKAWLARNRARLKRSKSLPYFVRYNPQYCKF